MKTPSFIYGTAWKKSATTKLVIDAVNSGFLAIDTANQLKHYSEALVGDALLDLYSKKFKREDLWLQTKYTSLRGQQDEKPPYDPSASLSDQVAQSFESSLKHLHTDYLDSYLLHGPFNFPLLGAEDFEVWKSIEQVYKSGRAKSIGVSNMNFAQMKLLIERAEIKPLMLQNRCFADRLWDKEIRSFCKTHGIRYQGFSLLTANPHVLSDEKVVLISKKYQATPEQVIFRFAQQIGMIPITGTKNSERMKADLSITHFELTSSELEYIENIG